MKKVLTIAGSDPCGGAGIAADLKTFQAFGVYGMSVVTAVTAQNTVSFAGALEMPAKLVALQIDSVMSDIGADAWKTGMLATSDVVATVAKKAKQYGMKRLVVDPVMLTKTGKPLLARDAIKTLIKKLIPLSFVITPNIDEAQVLTGVKITSVSDMKRSAVVLHNMGARNIVVKGGHLDVSRHPEFISGSHYKLKEMLKQVQHDGVSIDILFDGKKFHEFRSPRIKTRNTHGTGCVFASAIVAELAMGKNVKEAVSIAKKYVTDAVQKGRNLRIGHGSGPLALTMFDT